MRRYFTTLTTQVCMFLLFFSAVVLQAADTNRPNIVVMMVDDMGFAGPSIAPYGNPNYKTPGMDRLASEGMRFTDFHASGAICSATRAGLVTGRYQQRAGIEAVIHPHSTHPEHRKGLQDSEVTFAELFKKAGYSTGLVGKWHLGYAKETPKYHPMNHGFDYFMGYVSGNIDYINHWGDHMAHDWWHGRKETKEEGYTTHLINKYALEFIEQNKDGPFCLYIAHESPHAPVQGPNDPIQRGPGAKKRTTPHVEAMKQMILEMDKGVEQVRAKLVELGLEKNTLFLFFSDNGDAPRTATGSPRFRGHKGSVYEGGTRVPAIAWWPGKIKPATSTDALSITLDVMPTILSVAGIGPPKERPLDGIDLSSVLFEQKALPARPLYWANLNNNGSRAEALRDGRWKLVVQHPKAKPGTFENETIELFNLVKDESEKTNLAAAQPERAAAMLKQLKAWYADTQKTASPQPGGWLKVARIPPGARQAETDARALLAMIVKGQYEKAAETFGPEVKAAFPAEKMKTTWETVQTQVGRYQSVGKNAKVQQIKTNNVVDLLCTFELTKLVFRVSYNDKQRVVGIFFKPAPPEPTSPDKDAPPDVQLKTDDTTLFGTIDLPKGAGPFPVVLIISGSGPNDRDGNQVALKSDYMKKLAASLTGQGIAVLRYDKRGSGKSKVGNAPMSSFRFDAYIDDAVGWVSMLRKDKRFSRVGIIGHSQGSLVAMLAAKRVPVDAIVSIAGAGRSIDKVLRTQLGEGLKAMPELRDQAFAIIEKLAAGKTVEKYPEELAALFKPSIQGFLISWMNHDPVKVIEALKVPILIVQGTRDIQVMVEDAQALKKAQPAAELVLVEKMNHVLRHIATEAEQLASYGNAKLPLDPALVPALTTFLKKTLADSAVAP